ncbi:MAG: acylphosphatase [Deltaproteobacteria bacterium]|nr:acylphosphatase [Deltaproteobacteria bacterium]
MTRVRLIVRGRVQGVGFRWATVEQGRRLGLAGWARNLPDGSVEVVAEGAEDAIMRLRDWCRHGPPSARVSQVAEMPAPDEALAAEFRVRV